MSKSREFIETFVRREADSRWPIKEVNFGSTLQNRFFEGALWAIDTFELTSNTPHVARLEKRIEALRFALKKIEFCPRSISYYVVSDMQKTAIEALRADDLAKDNP